MVLAYAAGGLGAWQSNLSNNAASRRRHRRIGLEYERIASDPTYWQPHLPPENQPGRVAPPAFSQQSWGFGSPLTYYMSGYGRPTPQQLVEFSGSLPGLGQAGQNIFLNTEAQSPIRTAAVGGAEFGGLPPEVALQLSGQAALIPQRIGLTGYYGGLARQAMEYFSPELGLASAYIREGLSGEVPESLRSMWQDNIREGLAVRGLNQGQAGAFQEARALTQMQLQRQQDMLGPAIGLGTGLYEQSGLGLPTSISGVAMSQLASQRRESDKEASWARTMAWATGATNLISSLGQTAVGLAGL